MCVRVVWVLPSLLGACVCGRGVGAFGCGFSGFWLVDPRRLLDFLDGARALLGLGQACPPGTGKGASLGLIGLGSERFIGTGRAPPAASAP